MSAPNPNTVHCGWQSKARELADWTLKYMVNRTDAWGGYLPLNRRGPKPGGTFVQKSLTRPAKTDRGRVLLNARVIMRHFAGRDHGDLIGLHTTSPDNTCKWFGIDVDKHGD